MGEEYGLLAIDLGTSGAKASIVTLDGDCVGWAFEAVPLELVGRDGAEQNPNLWWAAINRAAGRLIAKEILPKNHILGICSSSMGEETVPVDRNGRALMNALNWMDQRGGPYIRKQLKGWINPFGTGYGLLNLLKWLRYTGGIPSPSGKDPAGHIAYIRDELPEIYLKTHKFLNSLDFINLRLTGEYVATYDSILPLWVTDNRDLKRIRFHSGLLSSLGIDREKLPDPVPATQVIGNLRIKVAQRWGLGKNIPVIAGSVDTSAATIGSGAVTDFDPCLTIGTSSYITAHVPFKKTDLMNNMASFPGAVEGKYLLMNNQTSAGGNLSFIADNIVYHKDSLLQEEKKPDLYKVFDAIVQKVPAGSNGLLYTPWIFGERSPVDDHFIRGSINNLSMKNNREDIIRSVFEGVAFNSRWLLEGVTGFLRNPCNTIRMVGGGAVSDVWCQIYADILNRRIHQIDAPMKANARGAAFIGAVGIKAMDFDVVPQKVGIRKVYEPDPGLRQLYDDRYLSFRQFYTRTKGIYKRMNRDLAS